MNKTLRELLEGIIAEVKQQEQKPKEKREIYDTVTGLICRKLTEQTGLECWRSYSQKGTSSTRRIQIKNVNGLEILVDIDVKLTKAETKSGHFGYSYTYYSVKDIILNEYDNEYNRTIEQIFADMEQAEKERLNKKADRLPETISEFNSFISNIQNKMNNQEEIDTFWLSRDFDKLIKQYNESIKASKTVITA